jgi:AraC-like DNA-binding protein
MLTIGERQTMDDRLLVLELTAWMEKHLTDSGSETELTAVSGYSDNRLRQKFYNVTGETPAGYLRKRRLTEAAKSLRDGLSIAEVALLFGYSSQDNFTTAFKSWFGVTPGELQTIDKKNRLWTSRMKEPLTPMELTNLKQEPLNTTLMGCMKGVSDYFELDWTVPQLFGYTTHAFLINIHDDLCPSSPYVWKKNRFDLALRNLGIRKTGEIELRKGASADEILQAERRIKTQLDGGNLCILDFLEHQLIAGYDAKGFLFLEPWNCQSGSEIPSLTFGTWAEALEREGWVHFTLLEKEELGTPEEMRISAAVSGAIRLQTHPQDYELQGYHGGDQAWAAWLAGLDRGLGTGHGHWWNASVWGECRRMAALFFLETGLGQEAEPLCAELSETYRQCADRIETARDREASVESKRSALEEARSLDLRALPLLKKLAGILIG